MNKNICATFMCKIIIIFLETFTRRCCFKKLGKAINSIYLNENVMDKLQLTNN